MRIRDIDIYHGVVLRQIAAYPTFTSINNATNRNGFYQINGDKRILIKYSTAEANEWQFTFCNDDFEELTHYESFIVLVCGTYTICLLSIDSIQEILDMDDDSPKWIRITYINDSCMHVRGPLGDLPDTIKHDAFPQGLFGAVTAEQEAYAWPPFSKLNCYSQPPELILSSKNRMLDLADNLTDEVNFEEDAIVYLGLSTISHLWDAWTEENLIIIENLIRYDLEFDGFNVEIERVTDQGMLCDQEFLWELNISTALENEAEEDENDD
ncbi:conserved hypothetical protein [Candidatus Methylobacter favarea]|uniref:Uncharacterized protein n=1 Tax=Candidatus Methylobacter favarea TaxID=2707345 RepID=A0A8S0WYG8_9GAMM|nr:hypothetical protein [Candidatus Methylobacter favarea]CAA9889553.1 conserved hypothetical protein [Candidatus Methylobacter favarea]